MHALAATSPQETVFLRADRLIAYGEVLIVMDHIRKAGVTKIALVTEAGPEILSGFPW